MKTFVFVIQTAWLSDVDAAVQANSVEEALILIEAEWPTKSGHRAFYQYSY